LFSNYKNNYYKSLELEAKRPKQTNPPNFIPGEGHIQQYCIALSKKLFLLPNQASLKTTRPPCLALWQFLSALLFIVPFNIG